MNIRNLILAASAIFVLAGCSSARGTNPIASRQAELAGGCHAVCLKCPPNQICPLSTCYLECNGKADAGRQTCVDTQMCAIGYTWSKVACACVPSKH